MIRVIVDINNFKDVAEKSAKQDHYIFFQYFVGQIVFDIVKSYDFTIVKLFEHVFHSPLGITFGYILSESHIVMSTYIENNHASISLESCKDLDTNILEKYLKSLDFKYKITIIKE